MNSTVITVWERSNEDKTSRNYCLWEHNHISSGYNESQRKPVPKGRIQEKSWPNGEWRKYIAKLINVVVVDPERIIYEYSYT